ncbi:MAG: hypothetical protein KAI79_17820 [Bacteroidales bacterium]|nr:hypothetical protein [Bacteroidales bacterium]
MRIWEVTLTIIGSIKVQQTIKFKTDKELQIGNIFRSEVVITNHSQGIKITSTVYSINQNSAYKIALLFIGKMLDVLSINISTPLQIIQSNNMRISENTDVKAIISKEEFKKCFEISRDLNLRETAYSRSLSWYRKGLCSNDAFDKFLAFWNAINVVASKYHTPDERTKKGIKNQIWNCFITLWGECEDWAIIEGDDNWIDDKNGIRDNIAHGLIPVDAQYVEAIILKIDDVKNVAKEFIIEWGQVKLNKNIQIENV